MSLKTIIFDLKVIILTDSEKKIVLLKKFLVNRG